VVHFDLMDFDIGDEMDGIELEEDSVWSDEDQMDEETRCMLVLMGVVE